MQITRVWGSFQCLKANMLEAKEPRLSFIGREKRDRFQGTGNVVIEDGLCGQLPPAAYNTYLAVTIFLRSVVSLTIKLDESECKGD